jgi:5-methyltetrahydrofolate--homocysteine methyltransferase
MTVSETLRAAAASRILIKDGPYGTAIQDLGLSAADYAGDIASNHDQKGNNDLLNLTRPDDIAGICNRYIAAGADLLATNTFNANRISQADYGMEDRVREINLAAARVIRWPAPAGAGTAQPATGARALAEAPRPAARRVWGTSTCSTRSRFSY